MRKKSDGTNTMIAAVLATLVVAGAGGYMFGQRSGENQAKASVAVVATVNDEKITETELYDRLVAQTGTTALDEMITEKLVSQAAADAKITVTQEEIDKQVGKLREAYGGEEKLQETLTSQGMTMERLTDILKLNLQVTKILTADTPLTDADLQAYYDANAASFDKREVHARQILVATLDEAKAVKAELDGGADFATVAKAKSTDTVTKDVGGDMGFIGRTDMSATFSDAAFNLEVNQISEPVQTENGYHVIQVLEKKGEAPTFASVKEDVRDAMVQQQVQEKAGAWLDELRTKAKIKNTLESKA